MLSQQKGLARDVVSTLCSITPPLCESEGNSNGKPW